MEKVQGGWFDREVHAFYDEAGKWVPSATQVIKLVGLSNFDMVDPDVLRNKQEIGTLVHDYTVMKDQHGELDPSWIEERCQPYFTAYEVFVREKNFQPNAEWSERPIVGKIYGMSIGLIPDRFGKLNGHDAVIELKCVEAPQPSWGVQTAFQEMLIYSSNKCGRAQRMALQLTKSGRYKLDPHTDHAGDANLAVAALTVVHARLRAGEKVWLKI